MSATTETRFTTAVEAARSRGVIVTINVMSCCRSCATDAETGMPETGEVPLVWTFGGQGFELVWVDGQPHRLDEATEPDCDCEDEEWDEDESGALILVGEAYRCTGCGETAERSRRAARDIYFYFSHDEDGVRAAQIIAEEMRSAGLVVEWGGSALDAVRVVFSAV